MIVLFDLDGTLTDSGLAIKNSFEHTCDVLGIRRPSATELREFIGPPLEVTFLHLLGDHDLASMATAIYRERYTVYGMDETFLYDGILDALEAIESAGHEMAVATSKDEIAARMVLDHLDLTRRFTVLAGAARDGSRHHKADVIAHALMGLGHDPTAAPPTVMVGDRDHDVLGARQFGIDTIGVRWGFGSVAEFEAAGARWQIDHPTELAPLIGALTTG